MYLLASSQTVSLCLRVDAAIAAGDAVEDEAGRQA